MGKATGRRRIATCCDFLTYHPPKGGTNNSNSRILHLFVEGYSVYSWSRLRLLKEMSPCDSVNSVNSCSLHKYGKLKFIIIIYKSTLKSD